MEYNPSGKLFSDIIYSRNVKLFDGGAYARFCSFLQKLTSKYAKELGELGIDVKNIALQLVLVMVQQLLPRLVQFVIELDGRWEG